MNVDVIDAIGSSYLAQGLNQEQLRHLCVLAQTSSYDTGSEIIQEFDSKRDLLILASGRAHVRSMVGDPIGLVKPGMPLGEVAFIDGRPRSGSVIALEPCEVVFFEWQALFDLLKSQPDIAVTCLWNVSQVLCSRLRTTNEHLAAFMPLDELEFFN